MLQSIYMKNSQSGLIRLIAVFKLFKASLLIAVGVGAVKLIHNGGGPLEHWVTMIGLNPGGGYVDRAISKVASIPPNLRTLAWGASFMLHSS